jgi:uncharacterized protein YutE (UPF0331/DUF86 family)
MAPGKLRAKVVLERLSWIERMLDGIRNLPSRSIDEFLDDRRTAASAESYLRRGLEALFDLGRHVLAKGFGRAPAEYKSVARELRAVEFLERDEEALLGEMAGYRNRMVHFYDEISSEELYRLCATRLGDIERIADVFRLWIREHPERIDESL